jgi:hypothetical protein
VHAFSYRGTEASTHSRVINETTAILAYVNATKKVGLAAAP